MWVLTPIGFFSIVEKPWDRGTGMLTVRARVRSDLDRLRSSMPEHGPVIDATTEDLKADYRYRARGRRGNIAAALEHLTRELRYDNFKSEVLLQQGKERANLYGQVWALLYRGLDAIDRQERGGADPEDDTPPECPVVGGDHDFEDGASCLWCDAPAPRPPVTVFATGYVSAEIDRYTRELDRTIMGAGLLKVGLQ